MLGAVKILTTFRYPNLDWQFIDDNIQRIRNFVWLDTHDYQSPREKIGIIHQALFEFKKYRQVPLSGSLEKDFYLNTLFQSQKANNYAFALLYLTITDMLDLPVRLIQIPQQVILGYYDFHREVKYQIIHILQKIVHFIDPGRGSIHDHHEIHKYNKKIGLENKELYYSPLSNAGTLLYICEGIYHFQSAQDDHNRRYFKHFLDHLRSEIER